MDTVPRLTGRQRRRSLKFGFPRAVRLAVAALVAAFFAGVLLGWSSPAHAIGTVPGQSTLVQNCGYNSTNYGGTHCDSAGGFCDKFAAVQPKGFDGYNTYKSYTGFLSGTGSSLTCKTHFTDYYGVEQLGASTVLGLPTDSQTKLVCQPGSSGSGATCVCNVGTRPNASATSCDPYQCPVKAVGQFNTSQPYAGPSGKPIDFSRPAYLCDSINTGARQATYGCTIQMSLVMQSQSSGSDTVLNWWSTAFSGATCNGGENGVATAPAPGTPASGVTYTGTPPIPDSASTCAMGTCSGVVNGANVCVACSNTTGTGTQSGSTAASGASATPGPAVSASTSCSGQACITTTTTSNPDGSTQYTVSQSTLAAYCAKTPGDPQCVAAGLGTPTSVAGGASGAGAGAGSGGGGDGTSAGFGGSCQAGWTCTGDSDAVTCAIATEQHRRDCQFALNFGDATSTSLDQKGAAMYAAGDLGDSDHPRRAANVSSSGIGTFDQTNLLGGSCPADRTIATVRGSAVILPLSKLCNPAQLLGQVLIGFTFLACIFIVLGHKGAM